MRQTIAIARFTSLPRPFVLIRVHSRPFASIRVHSRFYPTPLFAVGLAEDVLRQSAAVVAKGAVAGLLWDR